MVPIHTRTSQGRLARDSFTGTVPVTNRKVAPSKATMAMSSLLLKGATPLRKNRAMQISRVTMDRVPFQAGISFWSFTLPLKLATEKALFLSKPGLSGLSTQINIL